MKNDDLLKKWLNGELTDAEKQAFEKRDDFVLNSKIINKAKRFKASHFSTVDDFEEFRSKYEAEKKMVKSMKWMRPLLKVAAILVVAFGLYFYFSESELTLFKTVSAEKIDFELPDGSKVVLNALSQLQFNEGSWEQDRTVSLVGEAFFKVEKGNVFTVKTKEGKVRVLGTQFNVKQRDSLFEVACFEGSVKVSSNSIEKILYSGETFRMENDTTIKVDKSGQKEPEWLRAISLFNESPFMHVIEELERQYNVKVTLEDIYTARKFSGGFGHNNLKEALVAITKPMGLEYKIISTNEVVFYAGNGQ